jgi:hypothetical protein
MSNQKLSKKQRESRAQTQKILIGSAVGIGALMALTVGFTMVSSAPAYLEGKTLSSYMEDLDFKDHSIRLAGDVDSPTDVFVVGSSSCSHCINFVETGLDEVVEYASENNLTVDYMSLANSPQAIVSTRALDCFLEASDPSLAVKEAYSVSAWFGSGKTDEELVGRVDQGMVSLGVPGDAQTCLSNGETLGPVERLSSVIDVMKLQGTPSFYVASEQNPETLRVFSGYNSGSSTINQIATARTEQ